MRILTSLLAQIALAVATAVAAHAADEWKLHPDAAEKPDVPHGTVMKMEPWQSKIFPNTTRDWSVYVPAQYKPDGTAAIMVFQDGHSYANTKGDWRAPTVFDNLIASGQMPVTLGIFINPGTDPSKTNPQTPWKATNRGFEYDSLGDRYTRFLIEEILPEVAKKWPFSPDPELHAIAGSSSGGICAFTVAWERPDVFRKVCANVGSFVNLRGGNAYPSLIRKTERKPLRVYQADCSGDLDNPFGNWPLANKQMFAALKYMGYDARLDFAEGYGHGSKHGGSVFPDSLKWLWRKEKPQPVVDTRPQIGGDMPLSQILVEGDGWQVVADGLNFADGPTTDAAGNLYFCDMRGTPPVIWRISPTGQKTKLIEGTSASGLKFGPDGRLYACVGKEKALVAFELPGGAKTVLAENVQPNDLVVTSKGYIYFTETGKHQVTFVNAKTKEVRAADVGITAPNGIALSPDQGTLIVSDYGGENVWTFRIEPDGSLTAKEPYATMLRPIDPNGEFQHNEPPPFKKAAGGDGMITDAAGRYYVTTALGVQIFDPTGRMCGVLPKPQPDKPLTSCTLSGPNNSYLFVTNGDKIFRRKVQAQAVVFSNPAR
jgi:sugar lactone lactonase YvrE/enterochelin esterase-like enzyme